MSLDQNVVRRFPWWGHGIALACIALFTLWPLASVTIAFWLAQSANCIAGNAVVGPCPIGGSDWSGLIYGMGVMGWFARATVPLGGGAFLVWLATFVIHRIGFVQQRRVS